MLSFISISVLSSLLTSKAYAEFSGNSNYDASKESTICQDDDPLACFNLGVCREGLKPYEMLMNIDSAGLMPVQKRGMYCDCLDDVPNREKGFSGLHCTVPYERCGGDSDKTVCFNGGYCERDSDNSDYHCACLTEKGFAGKACESRPTSREGNCSTNDFFYAIAGYPWFCVNGGICSDDETDLTQKCQCEPGFAGLHCEYLSSEYNEDNCSLDCNGHGLCKKGAKDLSLYIAYGLDIDELLGGTNKNGEFCVCEEGYTGVECGMEAERDNFRHCGNGFCFNGGDCVERQNDANEIKDFFCDCNWEESNVAGEFCEHPDVEFCPFPEDSDPSDYYCANGGECPLGQPHEPCTGCNEDWTGSQCEIRIDHEEEHEERNECDLKCENGGACFFGDHPIEDQTVLAIPGLEFLQDNKHCRCPKGYIGLRCEMRYERCGSGEHYCLHGSGCVSDKDQFTCDCNAASTNLVAYAGHYCEHTALEFCAGPGAGKHSFCTEHGTCRGEIGAGQDHVGCECVEGWSGSYCEFEISALRTNGVATRVFMGFVGAVVGLILILGGGFYFIRRKNQTNEYESTAVRETHAGPYGEDEEDDEDYELKDVTII